MSIDDPVYLWTNQLFPPSDQPLLPLKDLNNMVLRIWAVRFPDEEPPRVKGPRSESRAETDGQVIHLPLVARYTAILLHEVAHVIELRAGRSGEHTREFIETVIDLYDAYTAQTREEMTALLIKR